MTPRRIGILGSGDVAQALGRGFAAHDWDVHLGTRSPDALQAWLSETGEAGSVGSSADAASFGDVVVGAVRGDAVAAVRELAGPDRFSAKLVLDTTNSLDVSRDGRPALQFGGTESLGERVQGTRSDASVVKCFNTGSNAQLIDPAFEDDTPPMLRCGNDADAKARTDAPLVEVGWPGALDAGPIESSRYLEALVPLWVCVGATLDTSNHTVTVARYHQGRPATAWTTRVDHSGADTDERRVRPAADRTPVTRPSGRDHRNSERSTAARDRTQDCGLTQCRRTAPQQPFETAC